MLQPLEKNPHWNGAVHSLREELGEQLRSVHLRIRTLRFFGSELCSGLISVRLLYPHVVPREVVDAVERERQQRVRGDEVDGVL